MDNIIPIGEFKTNCYQILEKAKLENHELIITKRGHAFARITPIKENNKKSIFGMLKGRAKINDDIISPIDVSWNSSND